MISLCMIVKNEEKYLAGCLESVKGIADEIILVDTGSADNTINIAKGFGAKIFHFSWINDFAAARNYSLQHAAGDWILYLDADERLNSTSVNELNEITSHEPSAAYKCKVISIDKNNHHSVMSYARLFPNRHSVRFSGKVHEQIEDSLKLNKIPVYDSPVEIIHLGYNAEQDVLAGKAERNLSILLEEYKRYSSSYYAYQLGQTYGILKRAEEAKFYFAKALEDTNLEKEYRAVAFRYIAITSAEKKDYNKALEYIERSLIEDDKQPLNLMAAAKIYLYFKMNEKAARAALKAFNANEAFFSKNSASLQNIMMDKYELCAHGIEVAIKTDDKNLFNFFYQKIKNSQNSGFELFKLLFNNEVIDSSTAEMLVNKVEWQYLEPLLTLLDKYSHIEVKVNILKLLSARFENNAMIHLQLGRSYLTGGKYEEGEEEIEKTIKINPDEPSYYFYLVSVYVQNSKYEKLPGVLKQLEERFISDPEVKPKIELLKQKLLAFLKH